MSIFFFEITYSFPNKAFLLIHTQALPNFGGNCSSQNIWEHQQSHFSHYCLNEQKNEKSLFSEYRKIIINFNCAFFWHFTIQLELALEQLTFSGQLLCIGRRGI